MGYSLNQAQVREKMAREYLAERAARNPKRTPSRTWVNAAIREPYTGNNMASPRAEADQHFQCKSAGVVAQIRRNV